MIQVKKIFGRVEIRSWFEFDGKNLIGTGSKTCYDKNGNITEHKVEPTGATLSYP